MLLRAAEVARRLGISRATLDTWVAERRIPHLVINGRTWFDESNIDRWLGGQRVDCREPPVHQQGAPAPVIPVHPGMHRLLGTGGMPAREHGGADGAARDVTPSVHARASMHEQMTKSDVARILECSPSYVRKLAAQGALHPVQTSAGVWVYDTEEVVRLRAMRVGGSSTESTQDAPAEISKLRDLPIFEQLDEFTAEWVVLRDEKKPDARKRVALLANASDAWHRSFDLSLIHAIAMEIKNIGHGCWCAGWTVQPLWAATMLDDLVGLEVDLYRSAGGWMSVPCSSCTDWSDSPPPSQKFDLAAECQVCEGSGCVPHWVTTYVRSPTTSHDVMRSPNMWLPAMCTACGGWGKRCPVEVDPVSQQGGQLDSTFRRTGSFWRLVFGGKQGVCDDRIGVRYIARLLASPRSALGVLELVAAENRTAVVPGDASQAMRDGLRIDGPGHAGEVADAKALGAYRRRLKDLQSQRVEAERNGDQGRIAKLNAEVEQIDVALSQAVGMGRRVRRSADSTERARKAVTKAINEAIDHIREQLPDLADHLDAAISRGAKCSYSPPMDASWLL